VRVFIVRHAEAKPGEPDELRPLTESGRAAARALARRLASEGPKAVLSSPLLRARETAEPIAEAAGVEPRTHERLAPGASVDDLRAALDGVAGPVVVVGHQPDCSEILLALTGRSQSFPPAGVAEVDL
jgi:phosphohistidine phosphatase SixA